MSGSSKPDTSIAFVDVITNGLGGMLVLFFIVVVVQAQLDWGDRGGASSAARKRLSEPFVLVVKAKDGSRIFDAASGDSPWSFDGFPPGSVAAKWGDQWDWGQSYGVFVTNQAPGVNASVSVRVLNATSPLTVEAYPAGGERRVYSVDPVPGGSTGVWPPPAGRAVGP